ncbi:MAG: MarR family winged helix-turn-helix transcriptional regulator [Phycisphaerales bacterium]
MSSLGEQIGKRQPFDLPEEEAYLNIIRSAALLSSAFNRLFKGHGLTESSYNALRILRAAGETGRTWTDIRDELVVPQPDVTRLLGRLERQGLVCRERSIEDRRVVRVFITDQGRRVVEALDAPIERLHRRLLGHMPRTDLNRLSSLLVQARNPND